MEGLLSTGPTPSSFTKLQQFTHRLTLAERGLGKPSVELVRKPAIDKEDLGWQHEDGPTGDIHDYTTTLAICTTIRLKTGDMHYALLRPK